MLYIDPIVSEWIETERMLCMPLFSLRGIGIHVLIRLYADRIGIDLDTISVPEYIDAIQDWKTRLQRAFDRAGEPEAADAATTKPKHTDHATPIYLEGYIDKLLRSGIVTLDNYHLCLKMPVCAFYAGVWGAIHTHDEIYERQGDLMAEIATIFGNGKKKFKSSDFYNTSHTDTTKRTTEEVYQEIARRWGLDMDQYTKSR